MTDLGTFMAATRRIESGSFRGNYSAIGRPVFGDRARGAYQIMGRNWDSWAAAAGLPGANWRDGRAQDRVAAYWMTEYFRRYGNWELVAAAWFGGGGYANRLAARGYNGPMSIRSTEIRQYVQKVSNFLAEAQGQGWQAPPGFDDLADNRSSWIFPVAGRTEWSSGDYRYKRPTGDVHHGIDIFAEAGTPVVAPIAGKVIGAGTGARKGGNWVKIQGNDGIAYYFAHLRGAPKVWSGENIQAGGHIGYVGTTGSAKGTRPHLHFTMKRSGQYMNPTTYLSSASIGGGAYNPKPAQTGKVRIGGMFNNFVEDMANAVAGGERTDPRTIASIEGEVTEVEPDQEAQEIDQIEIERPERSVSEEIGVM